MTVPLLVEGGNPRDQRAVRETLASFPDWYVRAARISRVIIKRSPELLTEVAMYSHGTRTLEVYPGIGSLLHKALAHELAHGCDDFGGHKHYFSSNYVWRRIHVEQQHFDVPKYGQECLEYFADMMMKAIVLGASRLAVTNPKETTFITTWVFPTLMKEFEQ